MEPEISSVEIEIVPLTPEEQEELAKLKEQLERIRQETESTLVANIQSQFKELAHNRKEQELKWIESINLYHGPLAGSFGHSYENPYGEEKERKGREINIVGRKCDIAIAQGIMRQFSGGDKNWDIQALPNQTSPIPPEEAAVRAERLEEVIYKQLTNCKYGYQSRLAYKDRVVLGTGILKGPMNRLKVRKRYEIDPATGTAIPVLSSYEEPTIIRVDPWLFYPDDSVQSIDEAEFVIEAHPLGKNDLLKLSKRPDFRGDAIIEILRRPPDEESEVTESLFANFSDNDELYKGKYVVLERHGPIYKDDLQKLGIEPAYETPLDHYYGEVWVCQDKIIRIELSNVEGSYSVPYAVSTWIENPGSIFGIGAPLLMADNQHVVNVAWQMALENSQLSSGPQVVIDKSIIAPQNGKWDIEPWKIWLLTQYGANAQQAVQYINVPNTSEQLMAVLQAARSFAEEESGVPLLAQGLQSPTVGDPSATTQAIMQTNSTTILDHYSEQWDDQITQKVIDWMVAWNMQYNTDPNIKADFEIDVKSSTDLRSSELQAKNLEKILVQAAQNPVAGQIINQPNAFKALLSMMHLPSRNIIKTDEQIRQEQEAAAQNPQPDPAMLDYEVKMRKLELDEKELAFKATKEMEAAKMDFEEKMRNADIRDKEAEAQVIARQFEYMAQMAQLAARDEENRRKIVADLQKQAADLDTKRFLAGQDMAIKARGQALKEVEAEQAIKTGKGW